MDIPEKLHQQQELPDGQSKMQHQKSFLMLPHELLMNVLASLGPRDWAKASHVCRAVRTACSSLLGSLHFLDLKNSGAALNNECFSRLASKLGPSLHRIEIDCWHLEDESMALLPEGVEELALCGCDHHSDVLLELVGSRLGGRLCKFAWSGFGGSVSTSGFQSLGMSCRQLKSFSLDSGMSIDANAIVRTVGRCCPGLQEISTYNLNQDTFLELQRCRVALKRIRHKKRTAGAVSVCDSTLLLLVEMCPQLEELQLIDKTASGYQGDLTDTGLLALAERAATLRILKLKLYGSSVHEHCSSVAFMQLASACTNITHLDLCNFRRLTDAAVYEVVHHCPGLVELAVGASAVTDASLELLASSSSSLHLHTLSIKHCHKISEHGLAALGLCGRLESLNAGQASGMNDASVAAICSGNVSSLKSLVLNYGLLSDAAMSSIASCSHLQELALHGCPRITNTGLRSIAGGCPGLRYVSMSGCDNITDSGVVAMARACPLLQKVRLDHCRLLSNPSVRALSSPSLRVRYLSMQHCNKLSDSAFTHALHAASLRFLDIGGSKLTREATDMFHDQRPLIELCINGRPYDTWRMCEGGAAAANP